MVQLYKSILFTFGVFILGLLMYCLGHDMAAITLEQVLPLVMLYAIGVVLGLLIKPVAE